MDRIWDAELGRKSTDVLDLSQRRDDRWGDTFLRRHGADIPPTSLPVCAAERRDGTRVHAFHLARRARRAQWEKYVLRTDVMFKQVSKI
jgi:hypothetical protein